MDNPFVAYYHFNKCATELNLVVTKIEEELKAEKESEKPKKTSCFSDHDDDEDVENDYEELVDKELGRYDFFEKMFQDYPISYDVLNSLKLFYGKAAIKRVTAKIATVLAEEFESQKVKEGERIKELLDELGEYE